MVVGSSGKWITEGSNIVVRCNQSAEKVSDG